MKWFSCRTPLLALTLFYGTLSGRRATLYLLVRILAIHEYGNNDDMYVYVVVTTTFYSVSRTVHNLSDVPPHPTLSVVVLNFPTTHAEIIKVFKEHIQANPAKPNKKRVAVIDSISSNPGVILPWKEMVAICKYEGIWSVIDAAHSIGQEVGINLTESAPDFWVSVR